MCLIYQRVFLEGGLFSASKWWGQFFESWTADSSLTRFSRYSGGGTYFYKLTMFQALCQALNKHDLI